MNTFRKHPVLVVDLVGAALMLVYISLFLSVTVLRASDTTDEIPRLERVIANNNRALGVLRTQLDESRAQLEHNRSTLAAHGKLPEDAPVEEYFSFLSSLADRYELRVLSQYPLGSRNYPGLLEHRFAFELTGSLAGLARFFKDIEDSPYWADVGYLKIHRARGVRDADPKDRQAQLTLCLFSAAPVKGSAAEEG